jgi:heme O synthase-like polyprenyltransferase
MSCKIEEGYDIMKVRLNNEEGYMIVVVLMILSILTVIATAGTNNSITEQRSDFHFMRRTPERHM